MPGFRAKPVRASPGKIAELLFGAAFPLLLLGRLASAGQTVELPKSLERLFAEGVQAQKAGQLDAAEKSFLEILRQGGKISYVYNNLGIVYQMRGDHARAVAQFREAVRLQPDYAPPRILMGSSLLALGRIPEATRQLEIAVKLQPEEPLARLQLAKAYARAENYPARAEQLRALRKLAPAEPEYAYQLGDAYLKLAGWCAREIARISPGSARMSQVLGDTYRSQPGSLEPAVRAYQRAAQADPKLPGIHQALAEIYLEQGRAADALREIEQELAIVPESAQARGLKLKLEGGQPRP